MTENQILARELLCFLGSYPKQFNEQGHGFAGQLAVQLGNAILSASHYLERGQPQLTQPLNLWNKPEQPKTPLILFAAIDERLARIEKTMDAIGGAH